MAFLVVERGPNSGHRWHLSIFPATVGRDPSNQVVIEDDEVSRFHLRIKKRERLFICEDLESKNGTFLNGDRIVNATLKTGDKILMGSVELVFIAPHEDIHLPTELWPIDSTLSQDLGLSGPILIQGQTQNGRYTPIRLPSLTQLKESMDDPKNLREIFELQSNLLLMETLEDASNSLLKSIGRIIPTLLRGATFIWNESSRKLIPSGVKHFRKKKEPFHISQNAFEDVVARKQGVLLLVDEKAPQRLCHRLVIPMIHHQQVTAVVHLESDQKEPFKTHQIELLNALIHRSTATFDSLLLRREVDSWMSGMVESVLSMIEAKDTYTHGHSERVSRYTMAIADELRLGRDLKRLLLISSLCHDVGKIGVPDAILKKASMLSAEEYEEMKLHPSIGADNLSKLPNAKRFLSGIRHHHEKWDGTGYPDKLKGEDIPFFGRIVAIADAFDAMVSGRAYSGFIDQSDAMARLEDEKELFDPEILKACKRAHDSGALTLKTNTGKGKPFSDDSVDKTVYRNAPAGKGDPST